MCVTLNTQFNYSNNIPGGDDVAPIVDINQLSAIFLDVGKTIRASAKLQRQTALTAQVNALKESAKEMRSAADKALAAACIEGGMQIASGAVQVGMSGYSLKSAIKGGKAEAEISGIESKQTLNKDIKACDEAFAEFQAKVPSKSGSSNVDLDSPRGNAPQSRTSGENEIDVKVGKDKQEDSTGAPKDEAAEKMRDNGKLAAQQKQDKAMENLDDFKYQSKKDVAKGQSFNEMARGIGQMISGGGTIAAAPLTQMAEYDRADSKELEANAQMDSAATQDSNEIAQHAKSMEDTILQNMQTFNQSNHEITSSIARNI